MRKRGWGFVLTLSGGYTKTAHYFLSDGRSLCGRYLRFSDADLEDDRDNHTQNCPACQKKVADYRVPCVIEKTEVRKGKAQDGTPLRFARVTMAHLYTGKKGTVTVTSTVDGGSIIRVSGPGWAMARVTELSEALR